MQRSFVRIARLSLIAFTMMASAAAAQTSLPDSRWAAWVGCWQPVMRERGVPGGAAFVCVAPVGVNAVELAAIDSGKVFARDTIDASGAQTSVTAQGCSGWRSAQWSSDGRRVYLRSELVCSGGIKRVSTGMFAFSSSTAWVDVQSVRADSAKGMRSTRYVVAGAWVADEVPAEFVATLRTGIAFNNVSRMLAASDVQTWDVMDASKHVDASVVETWLIERGQKFELNGKALAKLADSGVPGSTTDIMVGLSYPERFALTRESEPQSVYVSGAGSSRDIGGYAYPESCYDRYWYPSRGYDSCSASYGYGYRDYYGYSYRYESPLYTGYYTTPVAVVDRQRELPHGTMVNGSGYTRSRPSTSDDGSSSSRGGSSPPPSSSGSSRSGSSSGSSSSGEQRTAHKKGG